MKHVEGTARTLLNQFEAENEIKELVKLRADGGPNRLDEALESVRKHQ
jgi:hypothetical protein